MASFGVSWESGNGSDYIQVNIRYLRISQESVVVVPASWHAARSPDSAWGVMHHALGTGSFLGDRDFGEGMLKFLRIEPKLFIKLCI